MDEEEKMLQELKEWGYSSCADFIESYMLNGESLSDFLDSCPD